MTTYTITRALSRINALKDKLAKASQLEYVATINSIKLQSNEGVELQKNCLPTPKPTKTSSAKS